MSDWNTFDTPIPDDVKLIAVYGPPSLPAILIRREHNWYDVVHRNLYIPNILLYYWKRWYPLPEINDEH